MEERMMVNGIWIKCMDKESLSGLMESHTKVAGATTNLMEQESSSPLQVK